MTEQQDNVSRETVQPDTDITPDGETLDETPTDDDGEGEGDLRQTFDRGYVEQLRSKSAGYRLRMKDAEQRVEQLERSLHAERVQRLDMVVDPAEVPFNPEIADEAELVEAIEQLLEAKPYLRKRKTGGDIGQHDKHSGGDGFSLLGALRANAG